MGSRSVLPFAARVSVVNWLSGASSRRAAYGDDCVIRAGMAWDNHASRAVAMKWCREFIEPVPVIIVPTRSRPPRALTGITVRAVEPREYGELAAKQNAFYRDYQLYTPTDAEAIATCLRIAPDGQRVYRYVVAVDAAGHLLAGARTWSRGRLKADTINRLPLPVRLINRLVHLLPADYVIREIGVSRLWHEPGLARVARYLWEELRWQSRDQGTTLAIGFDARDPVREAVRLKPWHQPRIEVALALHGPTPIDRGRLPHVVGRV